MGGNYRSGTTSILVRMPEELKTRVREATNKMNATYGVSTTVQEVVRRAIEEKCDRIERETELFLQKVKTNIDE